MHVFRLIERPLDPPDDILGLCVVGETVVAYNSNYWRRFSLQGKQLEEEYFHVALPVILEMIFLDIDRYVAVFWSGDFEYQDRRVEILYSEHRGKSETISGQQAFCLHFDHPDQVTVYLAQPAEAEEGEKDEEVVQGGAGHHQVLSQWDRVPELWHCGRALRPNVPALPQWGQGRLDVIQLFQNKIIHIFKNISYFHKYFIFS